MHFESKLLQAPIVPLGHSESDYMSCNPLPNNSADRDHQECNSKMFCYFGEDANLSLSGKNACENCEQG